MNFTKIKIGFLGIYFYIFFTIADILIIKCYKSIGVMEFQIVTHFKPAGDQPQAIDSLVTGLNNNKRIRFCLELLAPEKLSLWQMLLQEQTGLH